MLLLVCATFSPLFLLRFALTQLMIRNRMLAVTKPAKKLPPLMEVAHSQLTKPVFTSLSWLRL